MLTRLMLLVILFEYGLYAANIAKVICSTHQTPLLLSCPEGTVIRVRAASLHKLLPAYTDHCKHTIKPGGNCNKNIKPFFCHGMRECTINPEDADQSIGCGQGRTSLLYVYYNCYWLSNTIYFPNGVSWTGTKITLFSPNFPCNIPEKYRSIHCTIKAHSGARFKVWLKRHLISLPEANFPCQERIVYLNNGRLVPDRLVRSTCSSTTEPTNLQQSDYWIELIVEANQMIEIIYTKKTNDLGGKFWMEVQGSRVNDGNYLVAARVSCTSYSTETVLPKQQDECNPFQTTTTTTTTRPTTTTSNITSISTGFRQAFTQGSEKDPAMLAVLGVVTLLVVIVGVLIMVLVLLIRQRKRKNYTDNRNNSSVVNNVEVSRRKDICANPKIINKDDTEQTDVDSMKEERKHSSNKAVIKNSSIRNKLGNVFHNTDKKTKGDGKHTDKKVNNELTSSETGSGDSINNKKGKNTDRNKLYENVNLELDERSKPNFSVLREKAQEREVNGQISKENNRQSFV